MARLSSLFFALLLVLQVPGAYAARSLVINVYLHDDLSNMSDQKLHDDFFQHWLDEMHSFTDHPVEVVFRRNQQDITDIVYDNLSSEELLQQFGTAVSQQDNQPPFSFMNKHLLMTRNNYDHSGANYNAGLAEMKGTNAIASIGAFGGPAHEIGHMLGATHEDAELKFNGWVCETYTHPRVPARSNCYRYSDKNRANILEYIKYNSN